MGRAHDGMVSRQARAVYGQRAVARHHEQECTYSRVLCDVPGSECQGGYGNDPVEHRERHHGQGIVSAALWYSPVASQV